LALLTISSQNFALGGQEGKREKGLLKNPGGGTTNPKTDVVVVVIGIVPVAIRRTAIPWIVVPGAAAFGCLPHPAA
jgi:hypothetical protein